MFLRFVRAYSKASSGFTYANGTKAATARVAVDGGNGGSLAGADLRRSGGDQAEGGDEESGSVHVDLGDGFL